MIVDAEFVARAADAGGQQKSQPRAHEDAELHVGDEARLNVAAARERHRAAVELERRRPAAPDRQVMEVADAVALVVHHLRFDRAADRDRRQIAERDDQLVAAALLEMHGLPGRHLRQAVETDALARGEADARDDRDRRQDDREDNHRLRRRHRRSTAAAQVQLAAATPAGAAARGAGTPFQPPPPPPPPGGDPARRPHRR